MNPYTLVLSGGTCAGLEYGLWFMQRTADQAKKKGYTAILTDGTPQSIIDALKATDAPIYYGVGHGACYSEDTEILTENGWKHFYELEPGEKVATLNPETHELEYQQPTLYHKYYYKGKMLLINGRRINLLVTPDHRLYVSRPGHNKWLPFQFIEAKDVGKKGVELKSIPNDENIRLYQKVIELRREGLSARKIAKLLNMPLSRVQDWIFYGRDPRRKVQFTSTGKTAGHCLVFKRGAKWNCQALEAFTLPPVKIKYKVPHKGRLDEYKKTIPSKKVNIEDWLRFFGVWLAEGSASLSSGGGYVISITQMDDKRRSIIKEWVDKVGQQIGFKAWEEINEHSKAVKFKNKQVYEYLKQFGHAKDKYIPKEIKMLPPKYLKILLEAMVLGDGNMTKWGEIRYSTSSKRLADDVQEIAMKLNMGATIRKGKDGVYAIGITESDVCVTKRSIKWVDYCGYVYCVTVPNHIIYVRRNGKACWCGNCCAYTVQCMQMFLQAGPYTCPPADTEVYRCLTSMNLDLMRGRHVHLLSCLTGQYLGKELVYRHGARSYIGYKDLFIYGECARRPDNPDVCIYYPQPGEPPNELADFYTFIDSDAAGEEAILNMGTVQDAVNAIIAKMKSYIWKYTYGEWKDRSYAGWAALDHIHNLNALVAYGDMNWRPILCASATPTMSELAASFLAPFSLMFGIVGLATLPAPPKPPKKVEVAKK